MTAALSIDLLINALPGVRPAEMARFAPALIQAMERGGITSPRRAAAFLSQVDHASQHFLHLEEIKNYSAKRLVQEFPSHFSEWKANDYAHQPAKIAARLDAYRGGNRSESSGDGWKYRSRGLLPIAGRDQYRLCGGALGLDLLGNPDAVADPETAGEAAVWRWLSLDLNEVADGGSLADITRLLTGGVDSLAVRVRDYNTVLDALTVEAES